MHAVLKKRSVENHVVIITFQPLRGFAKNLPFPERNEKHYLAYRTFLFFFVGLGLFNYIYAYKNAFMQGGGGAQMWRFWE